MLQVVTPSNAEVLESSDLDISLDLRGYEMPSNWHDSRVCIGLASEGEPVVEQCFTQLHSSLSSLSFKATGLTPGRAYVLRAVLFERANAIAVSVRSFRVGGVFIHPLHEDESPPVTILTALQVALEHHAMGDGDEAESIYRQIISLNSQHADALHLLGLVFHQRGETATAIGYMQQALSGSTTPSENIHNSLGECLRAVGRTGEAIEQYQQALLIREDFGLARFNLGLAYQDAKDWNKAMELYKQVLANGTEFRDEVLQEAQIRICDLLMGQGMVSPAKRCWEEGLLKWPDSGQMLNELGNTEMQLGELDAARVSYESAQARGMLLSELNLAIALELEGRTAESMAAYQGVLAAIKKEGLPDQHIMIKMATLLPRIMPDEAELARVRARFESRVDQLLGHDWDYVDNAPPLFHGFTTGFHLAFHGDVNNRVLKTKLHRLYVQFCPALLSGIFLGEDMVLAAAPEVAGVAAVIEDSKHALEGEQHEGSSLEVVNPPATARMKVGWVSRLFRNHHVGLISEGIIEHLPRTHYEVHVFSIGDGRGSGAARAADFSHLLPANDLHACAAIIRAQHLDVLIYPEIGLDPVVYFLGFARLARVQAVFFGHPDTTGIPTIDYFISCSAEVQGAESQYSEQLYRMEGLGLFLKRPESPRPGKLSAIREQLHLPPSAHLYLVPQPLFQHHPSFDATLVEILAKDRLGYMVLLNSADGADRHAALLLRLSSNMTPSQAERVLFYSVTGTSELLALFQTADVVLDAFPTGGLITSFQALAMGAPVVTFPSPKRLAGRMTLAMYQVLGVMDCVATSPKEYASLVLQIGHNPALRASISAKISAYSYRLFQDSRALDNWDKFLQTVGRVDS
ncbi:unnamed protein product [Chrysoparadoxa australica]